MPRKKKEEIVLDTENEFEKTEKSNEKIAKDNMSNKPFLFDNLKGRFIIVKVGSRERPATNDDIKDIQKNLDNLFQEAGVSDKCILFVTHSDIEINII